MATRTFTGALKEKDGVWTLAPMKLSMKQGLYHAVLEHYTAAGDGLVSANRLEELL